MAFHVLTVSAPSAGGPSRTKATNGSASAVRRAMPFHPPRHRVKGEALLVVNGLRTAEVGEQVSDFLFAEILESSFRHDGYFAG